MVAGNFIHRFAGISSALEPAVYAVAGQAPEHFVLFIVHVGADLAKVLVTGLPDGTYQHLQADADTDPISVGEYSVSSQAVQLVLLPESVNWFSSRLP